MAAITLQTRHIFLIFWPDVARSADKNTVLEQTFMQCTDLMERAFQNETGNIIEQRKN